MIRPRFHASAVARWVRALQRIAVRMPLLGLLLFPGFCLPLAAEPAASPGEAGSQDVRLIEWQGTVQLLRSDAANWETIQTPVVLRIGDRMRTRISSRATLQFSDRSVFRLNQLSTVEIQPVEGDSSWKRLFLRLGSLFFLDREKPSAIEIRTPTATSAIRGTEFLLSVAPEDARTDLTVFEGWVQLQTPHGTADATDDQQASASPGQAPILRPASLGNRALQWALHYPEVLHPAGLALDAGERTQLRDSLAALESGSTAEARRLLPPAFTPTSTAGRVLIAGLDLSVGRLETLWNLPEPDPSAASPQRALRRLAGAMLGEAQSALPPEAGASEWLAESYHRQVRGEVSDAFSAACRATDLAPDWGVAWVRRAELEWGTGRRQAALESLRRGRTLAPRHARARLVEGFLALDRGRLAEARSAFEQAWALDSSLGEVAAGRGLVAMREGHQEPGLAWMQVAAALEPTRSILRAYLGKAYAALGEAHLADHEFALSSQLDPSDPTPWLYRALHEHQTLRYNDSIRSLEHSLELSGAQATPRTRLLLDHDRAVRRADLSAAYLALGLPEAARRAASRAGDDHPSDFAAHLFRARALQADEDPNRFDLRLEPARQTEVFLSNLLAPPQGAALSLQLSQDEHLRFFEDGGPHGVSSTRYRTDGDWEQAASLFGTTGGLGYALDAQWSSITGDAPHSDREASLVSLQAKQRVTEGQGLFLHASLQERKGGDLTRLYDPATTLRDYRHRETALPLAAVGYDVDWDTAGRTIALLSVQNSRLRLHHPQPDTLFLRIRDDLPRSLETDPFFAYDVDASLPLTSFELQHLLETDAHALVLGAAVQFGALRSEINLERTPGQPLPPRDSQAHYDSVRAYAYDTLRLLPGLRLTAGLALDAGRTPANPDWPPLDSRERSFFALSPKVGLTWEPWRGGLWRAAWGRSLGGFDFASSLRLEPTEVAGFLQSPRHLIAPSLAPSAPAEAQELLGIGFDQRWDSGTYAGFELTERSADGERHLGAVRNATLLPIPDTPLQLPQESAFRERTATLHLRQRFGSSWSVGAAGSFSQSLYHTWFPTLPASLPGVDSLSPDAESFLTLLRLGARYQHPGGFHAGWDSEWWSQHNSGDAARFGEERFWQHHLRVGYTFPRHHADLEAALLNLTDQDFRLYPLSDYLDPPRGRTLEVRLRLAF